MKNNIHVPYAAMKELIAVFEKHKIPYSFGDYYTTDTEAIQGHWLTVNTEEICTEELDEDDHLYNNEGV